MVGGYRASPPSRGTYQPGYRRATVTRSSLNFRAHPEALSLSLSILLILLKGTDVRSVSDKGGFTVIPDRRRMLPSLPLDSAMVCDCLQHARPCQSLWESDRSRLCLLGDEILAGKIDTKEGTLLEHIPHPEVWARVGQMDKGREGGRHCGLKENKQWGPPPLSAFLGGWEICGSINWYNLSGKKNTVDKKT